MDTVFDVFVNQTYTFLRVKQSASGNEVEQEYEATGIVKLRDGMTQTDNMEQRLSTSTIHVRPTEAFVADLDGNLVGHGVRVMSSSGEPLEYRITAQTVGRNFDTGADEHIRVEVKKESFVWQDESELSLT